MMRPTLTTASKRAARAFGQQLRQSAALSYLNTNSKRLASTTADAATIRSRFERINARLPRFLQRYTSALVGAPVTHISAFLILHELTAIVPLFGLAGFFHYTQWLPPFVSEWKWIAVGTEKFGNYFRRKGWVGPKDKAEIDEVEQRGKWTKRKDRIWNWSEGGSKLVVEFATAYAITKALIPLRLILSVWATPWFAARTISPLMGLFSRDGAVKSAAAVKTAAGQAPRASPAGGTNAIDGGVAAFRAP